MPKGKHQCITDAYESYQPTIVAALEVLPLPGHAGELRLAGVFGRHEADRLRPVGAREHQRVAVDLVRAAVAVAAGRAGQLAVAKLGRDAAALDRLGRLAGAVGVAGQLP